MKEVSRNVPVYPIFQMVRNIKRNNIQMYSFLFCSISNFIFLYSPNLPFFLFKTHSAVKEVYLLSTQTHIHHAHSE